MPIFNWKITVSRSQATEKRRLLRPMMCNIGCVTRVFGWPLGKEKKALRVLEDAEMYSFGAEIEYCRIACLFSMGKRSEALYRLGEALQTDFDKHETILTWQPTLAENADFQAVIKSFQPTIW